MASVGWSFGPVGNTRMERHLTVPCCPPPPKPTFGTLSGLSLGSRLWLNLGLSNMRAKGLADVVKGLGVKRL